ncbi:amino acid permease [Rhizohabitans arisaemae]|uniref:amino acid permease n=1 Tax=Rhizohabitans arisaemae TaxID=2720610 RepID=UPI0024B1A2F8|nr:amino acid permease [Rhizohabitans arisaemae]
METAPFTKRLFRTKPTAQIVAEGGHGEGGELRRSMGLVQLTLFSVGATLGTGIFVVLGEATPLAGPAIVVSFVLAALTALFSALSYAELAGTIPVSGSSYSYAYATLGELVAWVCGWCLLLEYAVSVSAVAVGWGQYLNQFLGSTVGWTIPEAVSGPPGEGGVINLTAMAVVFLAAGLLLRGASESATANVVMVFVKVAVLVFFCVLAFTAFDSGNLAPFAPLGLAGISAAGAKVFFSYIGFDAASTAGEEAKNPKRDLPLAILLSLGIVTLIYVGVALAAVGAVPWMEIGGSKATLAVVLQSATDATWPGIILSVGAVVSIASVVLVVLYGQTRILFAMSRDGLIPRIFQKVNPRRQVPVANTVIVSLFVALLAGLVPLGRLADATSIGTLFAFAIVNIGVIVLRFGQPGLPRSFRTPLYPITPVLGVGFCGYLMVKLDGATWLTFTIWTIIGLIAYFLYGFRRSRLAQRGGTP